MTYEPDLDEVEHIRAHHEGDDHESQPCGVIFDDGSRSPCDIHTLLAVIDRLRGTSA